MTVQEELEIDKCNVQGDLFVFMAKNGYDMSAFVQTYMTSDFCYRHMDSIYSSYQYLYPELLSEYFFDELDFNLPQTDASYNKDVFFWMGFTYRYVTDKLEISSYDLYQKVPYNTMLLLYEGYHTIDDDIVVDRIREDFFTEKDLD